MAKTYLPIAQAAAHQAMIHSHRVPECVCACELCVCVCCCWLLCVVLRCFVLLCVVVRCCVLLCAAVRCCWHLFGSRLAAFCLDQESAQRTRRRTVHQARPVRADSLCVHSVGTSLRRSVTLQSRGVVVAGAPCRNGSPAFLSRGSPTSSFGAHALGLSTSVGGVHRQHADDLILPRAPQCLPAQSFPGTLAKPPLVRPARRC